MSELTQQLQKHVDNATIQSISRNRNNSMVTISYRDCARGRPEELVLIVTPDTRIRNEQGRPVDAQALRRGMIINATFSAAMTRSIPPQAQAFSICIVQSATQEQTTVGRIVEVNQRQQFITTISDANPASLVRFNITPNTIILGPANRRVFLNQLFPGLRVRVTHANFMTASIPPQTTAFVIQIIR